MLQQIYITNNANANVAVQFIGRCRVRIIRIDYVQGDATNRTIAINSQSLFNNVAGSRLIFSSNHDSDMGSHFEFDCVLNGLINLNLTDFLTGAPPANITSCILSLDITPMNN